MSETRKFTADEIMEQVQVYASSWALVGGRFDRGMALQNATEALAELDYMVRTAVAERNRNAGQSASPETTASTGSATT